VNLESVGGGGVAMGVPSVEEGGASESVAAW